MTDPSTWSTLDHATDAAIRLGLSGVGRVVVPDDGLSLIDLDGCRDAKTGDTDPWAEEILAACHDTYAEVSPSGTGYRLILAGHPPAGTTCRRGHVELYTSGRYCTITGQRLPDHLIAIAPAGERLAWLAERYLRRPEPEPAQRPQPTQTIQLANADLLRRALAHRSTGERLAALMRGERLDHRSQSEADYELARLLGYWCGGDADRVLALMRGCGAWRDKWARPGYLALTIREALASLRSVYTRAISPRPSVDPPVQIMSVPPPPSDEDTLVRHIRELRQRHGRPVGLGVRQAMEVLGVKRMTAWRHLKRLVEAGKLVLVTTGTYADGLVSEYDLPEYAVPAPTPEPARPAKPTSPPASPPYIRTPGGLVAVWRWTARDGWQHLGDYRDRAAALDAPLRWRARWLAIGDELRYAAWGRRPRWSTIADYFGRRAVA